MISGALFVDAGAVHQREVKLPNGAVHTLFFKDLTQKDFREFQKGQRSEDEQVREEAAALLVSRSLCGSDGTLAVTVEQALTLKPAALLAIQNAILIVNDFTEGNA